MFVYHVERDIEHRYISVFDALESLENPWPWAPRVSRNTMPGEDTTTPRICVAGSIEECFMGCTLFPFRRCCANVLGMSQYAGPHGEAYPIIVNTFDVDNPYVPSAYEVPDAPYTGELWLVEESIPIRRELLWLTPDAIEAYGQEEYPHEVWPEWEDFYIVNHVNLLTTEEVMRMKLNHPWLNRQGHTLGARHNAPLFWARELRCLADAWQKVA